MLLPTNSYSQESSQNDGLNLADIPVLIGGYYIFNLALGMAHQLGPIVMAKLFSYCGAELAHKDETHNIYLDRQGFGTELLLPEYKNELLNAIMYGSAPVAGFIGCYLALKGTDLIVEYNKSSSLKEALKNGFKKDLFNTEQPDSIKGWILLHAALNSFDCIPRTYKDGNGIGGNTAAKVKYALRKSLEDWYMATVKI